MDETRYCVNASHIEVCSRLEDAAHYLREATIDERQFLLQFGLTQILHPFEKKEYFVLILATLALIVIGFFFPPAWLLLVVGVIYFFASHKSRRAEAVERRLKRMVAEGKTQALSSELFFDAARSYAISKGAKAAEKDAASTYFVLEGITYFVVFTRAASGGTMISVRKLDEVREQLSGHFKPQEAESFPKNSAAMASGGPEPEDPKFEVGGIQFEGDPESDSLLREIVRRISDEVDARLKLDEQSYHYVMEEAEWVEGKNSFCQELLDDTGLQKIEYTGAREWAQNRSDKRVASVFMETDVWPDLRGLFGDDKAECIRAIIFGSVLERNRIGVDAMRGKYAAAFAQNLGNGEDPDAAREWNKVIEFVVSKPASSS